jgi:hypothetical protein
VGRSFRPTVHRDHVRRKPIIRIDYLVVRTRSVLSPASTRPRSAPREWTPARRPCRLFGANRCLWRRRGDDVDLYQRLLYQQRGDLHHRARWGVLRYVAGANRLGNLEAGEGGKEGLNLGDVLERDSVRFEDRARFS